MIKCTKIQNRRFYFNLITGAAHWYGNGLPVLCGNRRVLPHVCGVTCDRYPLVRFYLVVNSRNGVLEYNAPID